MIDFDALVTGPCVQAFGSPITIFPNGAAPIATLADGVTPLLGIFERAMSMVELDRTGVPVEIVRPIVGVSLADLHSAGVDVESLGNGLTQILAGGTRWQIGTPKGPDSQGSLTLPLIVTRTGV